MEKNGFVMGGGFSAGAQTYVSSAGDVNGDGRDDVMLGAPGVDVFSGRVYVIFGQSSFTSPFSLSTLDGSNGFI
ncbi:MAG: integrin alpha [Candidatus Midichloria mitochondrii]|nr:integrin alpha [Candidatus Midichloria mitochondrii]